MVLPIKSDQLETIVSGIRCSIPIVLGYLPIGFATGIVGGQAGLSALEIICLSLLLYAGSAQFVFATLLGAGAGLQTIVVTVFLVNFRYFLYSTVLAQKLKKIALRYRIAIGAQLTDESFSVSCAVHPHNFARARGMIALNATSYFSWVIGSIMGAIIGRQPIMENLGAEFLLVTMFAALLMININGNCHKIKQIVVLLIAAVLIVGLELWHSHPLNIVVVTVVAATLAVMVLANDTVEIDK